MVELKIFWTSIAIIQRDYIFKYWNDRNKSNSYSRKLNLCIRERLELLKTHPEMGTESSFKKTRIISLGHYSILYQIRRPKIFIIGLWDNRRNPKDLIKFLREN